MRLLYVLTVISLSCAAAQGQCTVSKDVDGQIITSCDDYQSGYKKFVYLGTPYLTFPTWLKGTIRLDQGGRELVCLLAYDLVTNTVQCKFDGSTTIDNVTPYAFTIYGMTFVRQLNALLGVDYQLYTTTLNTGQTTLAKRMSSRLVLGSVDNKYVRNSPFQGSYQPTVTYYIRKGEAQPEPTDLSRKSLAAILNDQPHALGPKRPHDPLTPGEVIDVLNRYDSLTTAANRTKPPLSADPVFNQELHRFMKYPGRAWNESVYGRVYVGFTITELGQVVDIATLSPANVGYGLDETVKDALRKLVKLNPVYKGSYCLPVAYTYTNRQVKEGTHIPVNVLPAERMQDRTVLAEVVVPIQLSKPVGTIREVWGYFR